MSALRLCIGSSILIGIVGRPGVRYRVDLGEGTRQTSCPFFPESPSLNPKLQDSSFLFFSAGLSQHQAALCCAEYRVAVRSSTGCVTERRVPRHKKQFFVRAVLISFGVSRPRRLGFLHQPCRRAVGGIEKSPTCPLSQEHAGSSLF